MLTACLIHNWVPSRTNKENFRELWYKKKAKLKSILRFGVVGPL